MMNKTLFVLALSAATVSMNASAADVGVSVTVGQPGFYSHVDIGDFPAPQVYTRPVLIQPVTVGVVAAAVYLRVPADHRKHWNKYCANYNACSQPVHFVHDNWYANVYAPRYREHHDDGERGHDRHDEGRDHDRGEEHGHGRD